MCRKFGFWGKKAVLICLIAGLPAVVAGQENATQNPLAPFENLVGCEWHFEGGYQAIEWGVGKLSVQAKSCFIIDGAPQLVSEGLWFYHPGEHKVRGYFTAIQMPVQFFDYTMSFEDNRIFGDLKSYNAAGKAEQYREVWHFTDADRYEWQLLKKTAEGEHRVMSSVFERK